MVKIMARPFSGQEDDRGNVEDPGRWTEHYEIVCLSNGWTDDKERIRNLPLFLTGEAEDWYHMTRDWIQADKRSWKEITDAFIARFRPEDFLEELEERLRKPAQKINESVRGYAGRYEKLRRQGGTAAPSPDACLKWWISGLHDKIKEDVLMAAPTTLQRAIDRAIRRETVLNSIQKDHKKTDEGKRPKPEEASRSSDAIMADSMAVLQWDLFERRIFAKTSRAVKGIGITILIH